MQASSTSPVITSASDSSRIYKHLFLPNGLKALLIADPTADKSAAALDVKIGGAVDPKPYYGLAHFLEHMLFMGTENTPLKMSIVSTSPTMEE
jgi:secreted Zn-dependent insulinase-like peptidase